MIYVDVLNAKRIMEKYGSYQKHLFHPHLHTRIADVSSRE